MRGAIKVEFPQVRGKLGFFLCGWIVSHYDESVDRLMKALGFKRGKRLCGGELVGVRGVIFLEMDEGVLTRANNLETMR